MNAAVLTIRCRKWNIRRFSGKTYRFLEIFVANSIIDTNWFRPWWDYFQNINRLAGSSEAIRRYIQQKFAIFGVPNIFLLIAPIFDYKFF